MNRPTVRYWLSWSKQDDIRKCLLENRNISASGCWEWTRQRNIPGYGVQRVDGKDCSVHRISKAVFDAFDRSCTLDVCHHCDNPPCFNPAHLFVGTHTDNMRDMFKKGRRITMRGTRQHLAKLTDEKVKEMRKLRAVGESFQQIGRRFGVSKCTAMSVCKGRTWKHVI